LNYKLHHGNSENNYKTYYDVIYLVIQ